MNQKTNELTRETVANLAHKAGFGMSDVRQLITKFETLARLVEQHTRKEDERSSQSS